MFGGAYFGPQHFPATYFRPISAIVRPVTNNRGDDVYRGTKPVVYHKTKVERQLDQVLETVENIRIDAKTSVKRQAVKQAREAARAVDVSPDYTGALQAIVADLSQLSRAAAEYETFRDAANAIAAQIEAVMAEMERKRIKRRREEELLIAWL
jgi:hypothetical protein